MASNTAQIKTLISVLGSASVLDADRWVETISSAFPDLGSFASLKKHIDNGGPKPIKYDGFVNAIRDDSAQDQNMSLLALASVGKSLFQFNDQGEPYGFRKGTNKDRCQDAIQDSLSTLLPLLLRVHVDEAIKKHNEIIQQTKPDPLGDKPVPLTSIHSYIDDDDFLDEFSQTILSETFVQNEQFFQDQNKTASSTNSWMNALFVYSYLRRKGQSPAAHQQPGRFNGNTFPKVDDARNRLSTLQTWLDATTAASEGATYSTILRNLASADRNGQKDLSLLKDKSAFLKTILDTAPLTGLYLPPHEFDVTTLSTATFLLVRLPAWSLDIGRPLDLDLTLGEASQNFMRGLTQRWNSYVENSLKSTLSTALEKYASSTSAFSVRGRNIKYPVTFEIREYGTDIVEDVTRLSSETGTQYFSLQKNDRLLYVEGNTDVSGGEFFSWDSPPQRPLLPDDARVMLLKGGVLGPRPEGTNYSGAGCFIEGTMVWTSLGELPIEDLRENDRILTAATSGEFGVKSDEVVANPTGGRAIFWGFNQDDVFFTAGHVFHTTTGHRAIDPVAAKRENPWLEVGKLRAGHTLYRTKDGESYELITIKRLHSQSKLCDHVWGVHLREGLRNYHANGYLVHLNYPEITVKSIADIIKTLSADQTVAIMGAIKELKPVFERFGAGTVEQLLERELSDDEFLKSARHKPQENFAPQPLCFQSRSFDLDPYKEGLELPEGYWLPEVDALDGVLYVNGESIERSKIYARGFSWSRNLKEGLWEHGMCSFGHDKQLIAGDGLVWIDTNSNPSKMSSLVVHFIASSTALREQYTTLRADGMVASRMVAQEPVILRPRLTAIKLDENTSETEKLLLSKDDTTEWFAPAQTLLAKEKLADQVEGRTPRGIEEVTEKHDLTWALSYDRSPYDENEDPRNALSYLKVTRVYKSEPGAPPTVSIRIPFLDRLAEARQTATGSDSKVTFYTSGVTTTQDHKQDIWIKISNGEAIALAADDNVDEDGYVKSYTDLTFKNSGLNDKLPFLFSSATLRVHNIENTLKGRIAEYDESMKENIGQQHWIVGQPVKAEPTEAVTREGSQSPAVLSPAQPAQPTKPSSADPLKSLINLGRGLGVDGELVKKTSQDYIYKAMLFHMDDKDRDNFTREAKPRTTGIGALPSGLASDLDENLRDWLKKTYSVAYVANMMSQQSEGDQAKMNTKFTEPDKKRLRYFWQGRGPGCLSRSNEYSQLNSIATTIAFRSLYPDIMTYVTDSDAEDVLDENKKSLSQLRGGRKWAYRYFHAMTVQNWVSQNAEQIGFHESTNLNPLEFHCTILSALWIEPVGASIDGTGLAKLLTEMVHRQVKDNTLFAYKLMVTGKDLATGMDDFMGSLIDLLMDESMSKAAGINPGIRQKLLDDMNILIDREKIIAEKVQKENVKAWNKAAATSVKASMSALLAIKEGKDYTLNGAKSILEFIRKRKTEPPKGETGIELQPIGQKPPEVLPEVGEAASKVSAGAKALAVAGLLFSVAATVWYVVQTWDTWKRIGDRDMGHLERTELVATGLQALGGLAFNAYRSVQLFKFGFEGPPKGASSALVQEAEHAAAGVFEDEVKRRQSWLNPQNEKLAGNSVLQKSSATAPMKLAEDTSKAASVNEQVLPKKPSKWVTIKGKFKMQFGVLETSLRAFACAIAIVLIVVSIISTIQSWNDKGPLEKWMAVIGIIISIVSTLFEIAALFCAVSPYLTVGIIVIGLIFQVVCYFTQKKKEPEDTPAQTWYKNTWTPFKELLPTPPATRFKWTVTPEGGKVGDETTISVVGTAAAPVPNTLKNLSKIDFNFTISGTDGAGLLNTSSLTQVTTASPGTNEATVIFPESYASYTTHSILDTSASQSKLRTYTASFGLRDAGQLWAQDQYKNNMPFLEKWLATGTEIKFVFRAKVNKRMRRPEGAKNEDAGVVPAWGKYRFTVQEHYTDDTGSVPEQIVEEELVFEKRQ
ncbi:hypothetical protein BU16DRAFT_525041 [Lophium mytilinum]|uniref:Uncharacterized protein n=1 Tax=Lophium mytilinum TaxID=390894 RepID=A0A6A6QYK5_9PEZI|nr:hypothetical protein BU16DRAFT_525041 [Lophium mytilinum]